MIHHVSPIVNHNESRSPFKTHYNFTNSLESLFNDILAQLLLYNYIRALIKQREGAMRKWIEKTFAAVSFAEAGEHDTAMKIAAIQHNSRKVPKFLNAIQKTFVAISYAEAGCHDMVLEFLGKETVKSSDRSLETFLNTVGLKGIRVSYRLVRV